MWKLLHTFSDDFWTVEVDYCDESCVSVIEPTALPSPFMIRSPSHDLEAIFNGCLILLASPLYVRTKRGQSQNIAVAQHFFPILLLNRVTFPCLVGGQLDSTMLCLAPHLWEKKRRHSHSPHSAGRVFPIFYCNFNAINGPRVWYAHRKYVDLPLLSWPRWPRSLLDFLFIGCCFSFGMDIEGPQEWTTDYSCGGSQCASHMLLYAPLGFPAAWRRPTPSSSSLSTTWMVCKRLGILVCAFAPMLLSTVELSHYARR